MKTIRLGIMGCGPRGIQMARITKLIPEQYTLTCMSDPDEKALALAQEAVPEIKFFTSSDDLLDSGLVDAVITEIPPAVHTEYVVKSLERGIHVLGEIPAVDTIEEGCLLWEKVNASKALYMAGSNPNYREKTRLLLDLDRKGMIGKVAYVETEYLHNISLSTDAWRNQYESCRYCTHSLGPVLALTKNEFKTVACMSTYDRLGNGRAHNAMCSLLSTADNMVVRLLLAFGMPYKGPAHTTKIFAEKGMLELYNERARYWLNKDHAPDPADDFIDLPLTPEGSSRPADLKILDEDLFRKAHYGHNGSDLFMMYDFADAILNGKPSPIGIKEALQMTFPGIYAAASAKEGGALKQIIYPWDM